MFRGAFIFPPPLGLWLEVTGDSDIGNGVDVNAAIGYENNYFVRQLTNVTTGSMQVYTVIGTFVNRAVLCEDLKGKQFG